MKIKYFAALRDKLGLDEEEFELSGDIHNVAALKNHLQQRKSPWNEALAEHQLVLVAVNHVQGDGQTKINNQDEVAFFPPVTGG